MPATIDIFKLDPLKFLKVFRVKIATSKASRIEPSVYYGKKRDDLRFDTWPNVDEPSKAETCRAHIVQAKHGAPDFYELTGECDLMLTTQLSGCCMILDTSGDTPKIAHVWPHTSACQCGSGSTEYESGAGVQDALTNLYPNCKVYGINDYVRPYAYVIGVNKGGWNFYSQERPDDGRITRAYQVLI